MNDELKDVFYEETDEIFQEVEDCLLSMESKGATSEKIDELFRHIHTLKGSFMAMRIQDMSDLTHCLEDILGKVREGKVILSQEIINQIFVCSDELKLKLESHKANTEYEIDVDKYVLYLESLISKSDKEADTDIKKDTFQNMGEINSSTPIGLEEKLYNITITLDKETILKGARLYIIIDKLNKKGRVEKTSWEGIEIEEIKGQSFKLIYITEHTQKEVEDLVLGIPEITKVIIAEEKQSYEKNKPEEVQSVIRVNIDKLDKLLRIVEELSVDKERLKQAIKKIEQRYRKDEDIKSLTNIINKIDFIGNEMQESVMSTRMYTLETVFRRFPRMVRDLSLKRGKEIELKLEGENTELDRSIIEKIIDPVTHILRNSIDHGIEPPEVREKLGKRRKGTIKISAGQEEGHIYIKVEDDGKGIDTEELRQIIIKKGLMTKKEINNLSEKEIIEIIFKPGFSTSDTITDISGRGVGMNVVIDNIERINGIIDIDNKTGQGLNITFKLPLTLATIQSLLIKDSKHRFALPLLSVIEILRIKESDYEKRIKFIKGKEVLNWRNEVLPIFRASETFNLNDSGKSKTFIAIVIGFATKKFILGVDEVLGQQQVVIKSLEKFIGKDNILGKLKGISGTAVLGDGGFAYVLDVQTLIKEIYKK